MSMSQHTNLLCEENIADFLFVFDEYLSNCFDNLAASSSLLRPAK